MSPSNLVLRVAAAPLPNATSGFNRTAFERPWGLIPRNVPWHTRARPSGAGVWSFTLPSLCAGAIGLPFYAHKTGHGDLAARGAPARHRRPMSSRR